MSEEAIVLVHLSDIHFNRHTGDAYDLDEELRQGVLTDARDLRRSVGPADAIVVTGDIAYSAQPAEYGVALEFLRGLADTVGCEVEDVCTTPGNHDVDWTVLSARPALRDLHRSLRGEPLATLDQKLSDFLRDETVDFFAPLENYNQFAAPFQSRITREQPTWERALFLNDGSVLKLLGLNSTLVSGPNDNDNDHRLILGSYQTKFARIPGVEYLTLCHHPPSWLRDDAEVFGALGAKACVQLFGHKHEHQVRKHARSVVIAAGAVQPERSGEEGWEPHYNWLRVRVTGSDHERKLFIELWPRVWDATGRRFVAHGDILLYEIGLDGWSSGAPQPVGIEIGEASMEEEIVTGTPDERNATLRDQRRTHYRYFKLPYIQAIGIAQELNLFGDADRPLRGAELLNIILRRARDGGSLKALEERMDKLKGS